MSISSLSCNSTSFIAAGHASQCIYTASQRYTTAPTQNHTQHLSCNVFSKVLSFSVIAPISQHRRHYICPTPHLITCPYCRTTSFQASPAQLTISQAQSPRGSPTTAARFYRHIKIRHPFDICQARPSQKGNRHHHLMTEVWHYPLSSRIWPTLQR